MKKLLFAAVCLSLIFLGCKKKQDSPAPETLLIGTWTGFMGDASAQTYPVNLVINSDLSFKMTGTHTANGTFKLEAATLHGPIKYTAGISGEAFLILTVNSDFKKLIGYVSVTNNGPSAGLHYVFTKP